jgi:hypothetical protein
MSIRVRPNRAVALHAARSCRVIALAAYPPRIAAGLEQETAQSKED